MAKHSRSSMDLRLRRGKFVGYSLFFPGNQEIPTRGNFVRCSLAAQPPRLRIFGSVAKQETVPPIGSLSLGIDARERYSAGRERSRALTSPGRCLDGRHCPQVDARRPVIAPSWTSWNVRFGSNADIERSLGFFRFAPLSGLAKCSWSGWAAQFWQCRSARQLSFRRTTSSTSRRHLHNRRRAGHISIRRLLPSFEAAVRSHPPPVS